MIRYALACSMGHEFEAWFASSDSFDEQAEANALSCPVCGESRVGKVPMAPHVGRGRRDPALAGKSARSGDAERRRSYAMLRELRDKLTANSDYVGPRLPEEARKIHYEEAPARGIHGEADLEEVRALEEEGIALLPLPRLPEDEH